MRCGLRLLILLLSLIPAAATAGKGPIVVVFDMQNKGSGLKRKVIRNLIEYLSARLTEGGYRLVPSRQIRKRLRKQRRKSHKACFDQRCQIEIGREFAAQKSLTTNMLRIGKTCQVTAVMYDLGRATSEMAATAEARCEVRSLFNALKQIAAKLCQPLNQSHLVVQSTPNEAQVFVDNEEIGLTPLTHEIVPGEYRIRISKEGYQEQTKTIKLRTRKQKKLQIRLVAEARWQKKTPTPELSASSLSEPDMKPSVSSWLRWAPWVSLGVSVAAGTGGAILGVMANKDASAAQREFEGTTDWNALHDSSQMMGLGADVLFGLATAAAVGTLVFFLVEPEAEGPVLSIAPWGDGAAATASTRF